MCLVPQVLENRTRDSKLEMEVLENLQELKELNQRQAAPDFEGMIGQARELEQWEKERERQTEREGERVRLRERGRQRKRRSERK